MLLEYYKIRNVQELITYCFICRKSGDKVVHITLVAVRKRFRKMGIGKYLINVSVCDHLVFKYFAHRLYLY